MRRPLDYSGSDDSSLNALVIGALAASLKEGSLRHYVSSQGDYINFCQARNTDHLPITLAKLAAFCVWYVAVKKHPWQQLNAPRLYHSTTSIDGIVSSLKQLARFSVYGTQVRDAWLLSAADTHLFKSIVRGLERFFPPVSWQKLPLRLCLLLPMWERSFQGHVPPGHAARL